MTSLSLQTQNSTPYNTAIVTANNVVKCMTSQQIDRSFSSDMTMLSDYLKHL